MSLKKKHKILIVDSHSEFRKALRVFLETQNKNIIILEAGSETSAAQEAMREKPDVVLLELLLPQMNGILTSRIIKEVSPDSKIVILTMFDTEISPEKFLDEHIDDFIAKSEFDSKLISVLRKHLKNHRISPPSAPPKNHLIQI
ncbi:MAG: response regulator transcription factor [Candidatus Riflebacteria bacterium]|nr:response regulator transcription factor [Candidatus Riflebacteria bacterium]